MQASWIWPLATDLLTKDLILSGHAGPLYCSLVNFFMCSSRTKKNGISVLNILELLSLFCLVCAYEISQASKHVVTVSMSGFSRFKAQPQAPLTFISSKRK